MAIEQWSYWKIKLEPIIQSKVEEWHMLGYENVTEKDVWECFIAKMEKNKDKPDKIRTHWIAAELFRLKANDYMNLLTIEAYKGPDWFDRDEPVDVRLNTYGEDHA
ncbi:post-transcriptional regulator [Salipaludibacillus sp. CUR1]|uniref:post-transcriptional regulator n=1 Tax=Salipaludibacillus sp. CUR1 TaxID=2820003 RepID=UPI001E46E899|nr:post-transcriptional regulator [Salipaludibacillus sp. CUR1]MCE7793759.1 post-transcriptional regulator [Salipaludibacillus sp. CUR1]